MAQGRVELNEKKNEYSDPDFEKVVDRLPAPAPEVLCSRKVSRVVTEISDEDYRCVWRPCHKLEEEDAGDEQDNER